ncbi:MAG: YqiJ family protein [Kaiparowitsia implicata GSE-PSE-MK54-09C]|jgi:hypothetical protein|nr:YqiJ family protein [Kaiparowitsia implicata GSE-PSE-MK54-09C]
MPLFDLVHLPYWLLLGMGILLYVIIIAAGGGDDLDADAAIDIEADADLDSIESLDMDADADGGEFGAAQILGWLGVGRAPLMLLLATDLSLWGLLGWMGNVFLAGLPSTVILLGSCALALAGGGQIAKSIGKVFAGFGEDTRGDRLLGCGGTVSTRIIPLQSDHKIGQVDVLDAARNLITVNAMLPDWVTVHPRRGDPIVVIDQTETGYLVVAKGSPDEDLWMRQSAK